MKKRILDQILKEQQERHDAYWKDRNKRKLKPINNICYDETRDYEVAEK